IPLIRKLKRNVAMDPKTERPVHHRMQSAKLANVCIANDRINLELNQLSRTRQRMKIAQASQGGALVRLALSRGAVRRRSCRFSVVHHVRSSDRHRAGLSSRSML